MRSYRTFSPLPCTGSRLEGRTRTGARRYIFCATVLQVALTGRYPAHCPAEFGLSSRHPLAFDPCGLALTADGDRLAHCEGCPDSVPRYPSVSCEIWYCSSFLYRLLRGVSITSAVLEMFQPFSRSLPTRNARSALSLNSRSVPALRRLAVASAASARLAAGCRARRPHGFRQVGDVDGVAGRHDDQPLDGIAELADVALPPVPPQRVERRRA